MSVAGNFSFVSSLTRHRSCSKMRMLLRLSPLGCCNGMLADRNARNIHTLLHLKNNKGYINPCHILQSQNVVHMKVIERFKSSYPFFKNLASKVFKDKDLEEKVKQLKKMDEERLIKAAEIKKDAEMLLLEKENSKRRSTTMLSNLIYGCTSSKHLLDLFVPWIESKAVSVDNTVKCIEHLTSLLYGEIMEHFPDLPYGSVGEMYANVKLVGGERKVFYGIHNHFTFQTLITYLEQNVEMLSKSQFASCFSCLTHLDVSHFDPVMTKFYTRIMNSDEEGYSVIDIFNLRNAFIQQENINFLMHAYVFPKLSQCLKGTDISAKDKDSFQALVYIARYMQYGMKEADVVSLYSCIYKASLETDCLNDLNSACELAVNFPKAISSQTVTMHKILFIDALFNLCLEKLEERTKELSPLKLTKVANLFLNRGSYRTQMNLRYLVEYFLKEKINELSLPETIWLLALPGITQSHLEPGILSEIQNKFKRLDLPNLYLIFKYRYKFYFKYPGIMELIYGKTLKHIREISQNKRKFHLAILFYCKDWNVNKDVESAFQSALLETYSSRYTGLMRRFPYAPLILFLKTHTLQPPFIQLLNEISKQDLVFKRFSARNFHDFLNFYFVSSKHIDDSSLCHSNRLLYETVLFRILYKSVAELYRKRNSFNMHWLSFSTNILMDNNKMDFLFKSAVLEIISKSPPQTMKHFKKIYKYSLFKINEKQKNLFLDNLKTFVLEHKTFLVLEDWRIFVKILNSCEYRMDDEDKDLQNMLQTVINREFIVDATYCDFVSYCSFIGVDVSEALKAIFSVEYLQITDQLIADNEMKGESMKRVLYRLNQQVCIGYPALKVPWFQERDDLLKYYSSTIEAWRYIPNTLSNAITNIAGSKSFVGKKVILDYGIPAWRVLLIDQNNNFVRFSSRNLKLADEMKYKRLIIRYSPNYFNYTFSDQDTKFLEQAGYSSIVIYRADWNSIGLHNRKDKEDFLRERIFEHMDAQHVPPKINCELVSNQWRDFLKSKMEMT